MDRKRTVKRNLAMLLVLSFLFALGGAAGFADGEDVTEPVEVYANEQTGSQSEAVGSVTVAEVETGTEHWPTTVANGRDGESAELTVAGDVSGTANTGTTTATTGVLAEATGLDSSADVSVSGDVRIEALDGASGFDAQAGSAFQPESESNEGSTATVTIGGDVEVLGSGENADVTGGQSYADNGGTASAKVGGDVTVESAGSASGSQIYAGSGGTASAEIGGDVTAESEGMTYGVRVYAEDKDSEAGANIAGNVTAESEEGRATGATVYAATGGTASLTAEGNMNVTGIGGGRDGFGATGIQVTAENYGYTETEAEAVLLGNLTVSTADGRAVGGKVYASVGGEATLTVGGDMIAEATGDGNGATKLPAHAIGATISAIGGTSELSVGGDLTASGMSGTGLSSEIGTDMTQDGEKVFEGAAVAKITGDLSGQDEGLWIRTLGSEAGTATAEVTVGGTLSAKSDEGTAVVVSEGVTPDNLKLTVWKIDLDQNDNAVVQKTYNAETGVMSSEVTETTRAIEQSIQYIIKIEPTQADVFQGTQETAKEGENAAVKVNVPGGFKLEGAFTDEGKQVELLKDAEGNYYVIMPKGGVYLSAKLSKIPAPAPEEPAAGPAAAPAVNDKEKEQETQAAEKAETEAVKVIAETSAATENGRSVVVANGTLDEMTATKEMKADFETLTDKLVDAGKALSADVRAAIPAEIRSDAAGDAPLAASQPFRSVASEYPATVTVKLDNPDNFVGVMSFVNGKWVKLNAVINGDGTVTYVLTEPSVISFITQTA